MPAASLSSTAWLAWALDVPDQGSWRLEQALSTKTNMSITGRAYFFNMAVFLS
jgi:hypothetical protein